MSPARLIPFLALVLPVLSAAATAGDGVATITPPRTLELVQPVQARRAPRGSPVSRWSAGTLVTSDRARGHWVRITGRFPAGRWRPQRRPLWVPEAAVLAVRPLRPKQPAAQATRPRTYELTEAARLRRGPRGRPAGRWPAGTRFTSHRRRGAWLAVSGHFPDGAWAPLSGGRWITTAAARDITPPPAIPRPDGAERYAVVDKSDFQLRVVQEDRDGRRVLYRTEVGLGMDGCLPESQGGRCYYTRTGTYRVRWRIYDPDGIDWCIPDSMAEEPAYAADLARGERCFDGALGKFAVNIGKSYAIHATGDPDSIGKRESHGCIRTRPADARRLWRYLREGDRVVIRE
ncbi:MAG TPA: L,D-transpeptidase [Gammaproteobacteria bacterium]|nr:L,D-transpeptidase [Gammaproteobacteria bacterium]